MPSSNQVHVTIDAANEATEIFVIAHDFQTLAYGVRRLETDLAPGIYKLRYCTGSVLKDVFQLIPADGGPLSIQGPQLEFPSSAPLMGTAQTHEYHASAARTYSLSEHAGAGSAQIFVFARDWMPDGEKPTDPGNPTRGLFLLDKDGRAIADLERDSELQAQPGWDPCAGYNVKVDPGSYRLRLVVDAQRTFEQVIYAAAGWQTQVCLLQHDWGRPGAPCRRANLLDATVLMAPVGAGFNPDDPQSLLADLARIGLANRRVVISPQHISAMVGGKFQDPMLGVYAGHLSLLASPVDCDLLNAMIGNLTRMVGDMPDVKALQLALSPDPAAGEVLVPPMLLSSWRILVAKSAANPNLIPSGSLSARVSRNLWGDGAWMIWCGSSDSDVRLTTTSFESAAQKITALIGEHDDPDAVAAMAQKANLNSYEQALLVSLMSGERSNTSPPTSEDAVHKLGIPRVAVDETMNQLYTKLNLS